MTQFSRNIPTPSSEAGCQPSSTVRTLVSFLLFLHLFALGVAITSNLSPSPLESKFRDLRIKDFSIPIVPYLRMMWMDLSYAYHLTYFEPQDADYFVEIELTDGPSKEVIVLPDTKSTRGCPIRYRRWERLAASVGAFLEDSAQAGQLPGAITSRILKEQEGSQRGIFRSRQHYLQSMDAVSSTDPQQSNPFDSSYYRTNYEAQTWLANGRVEVMKIETPRDVAPPDQKTQSKSLSQAR